ncbi:MAG TPA: MTH938/NDUFAF3 family protein [Gammaproteobacteria bacterium]
MKFTREQSEGLYTVHAFQTGSVVLNSPHSSDERDDEGRIALSRSFILSPKRLLPDWEPLALEQIGTGDLQQIDALRPELLLLGTGETLRFPGEKLLAALIGLGIGYEIMDSAAACRTYNILAGEGREVVAAIIIES